MGWCRGDDGDGDALPSAFFPQLIAWEPEHEEEATVVTVRPNFQDSVHVGYVAGLKKFTEYLTSVLCFTTPGDGPRSPPQLVRTHEDGTGRRLRAPRGGAGDRVGGRGTGCPRALSVLAPLGDPVGSLCAWLRADSGCLWAVPGPVGHLSFSEILDTSLKVSWQEPLEKNGILTGEGAEGRARPPDDPIAPLHAPCSVPGGAQRGG